MIDGDRLDSVQRANNEEKTTTTILPFANCTQAKEAGAAPVLIGDPGYSTKLDRDGDGVACE
ncbi:excalibur calcium-binding domain-containing protein [Chengkuizengella marina]|uniref:excalibur calcium-binding domain-containing protein n=1 Tax=Chengkuizengella marina TaxID=2507566 RepID=UPI002E2AE8E5|nr:excalibur calcium-binding domain-containing protein [Chengkuizengella marina]